MQVLLKRVITSKHLLAKWPNICIMNGAYGQQIDYLRCQL